MVEESSSGAISRPVVGLVVAVTILLGFLVVSAKNGRVDEEYARAAVEEEAQ